MPKIYKINKSGLRLFYKVRHHRGHGVHSPFVYNLITKVIEEKIPYYAYQEIKDYISAYPEVKKRITKQDMLSFRLVNYFGAKNILEIGSGYGINTLFLTASSSGIKCHCVELSPERYGISRKLYNNWKKEINLYTTGLPQLLDTQDCIYINLKNDDVQSDGLEDYIFNLVNNNSFVIIKGIRTNKRYHLLWKCLVDNGRVTVSLDLFNTGILFFDPKLHKRNYKISF